MRVTAEVKTATRERILEAARRLFADNGYEATTTRDIAQAAEIATGTLFNYFPTKEAIVACLANDALSGVVAVAQRDLNQNATLEEDLFALVALALRKLRPLRRHLPALLETSLSPLSATSDDDSTSLRVAHLEAVSALAVKHGYGELPATALQLYWTLYSGVLVFWANDKSPKQEDTLALIDDSLNMFIGWLEQETRVDSKPRRK
jgi:AcrR family transcriptional regulator